MRYDDWQKRFVFVSVLAASTLGATGCIIESNGGGNGSGTSCDASVQFGQNAIANGGAELDEGSDGSPVDVSCWERTSGCFTAMSYEEGFGGFDSVKPTGAGQNLLAGGANCDAGNSTSTGTQTVTNTQLSSIAGEIEAGGVGYALSADLGGWEDQDDSATIEVRFFDSAGTELDTASIGPISSSDRGGETKFLSRSTDGTVPAETGSIEVRMTANKSGGSNNDGVADNLELVFTN